MSATLLTDAGGLARIVGKSNSGDFVHASQKMAAEQGFRNVSKKWLDQTMSYEQGLEVLAEGQAETEDVMATVAEMVPVVENGRFAMKHGPSGRIFRPTEFAASQVASKANAGQWLVQSLMTNPALPSGEPKFIRDQQDAETVVAVIENGLRRLEQDKKLLWRTRKDGTLRAVLTEQYAIVNNEWFLNTMQKLIPGGRLSHWRGDSDTVFGNVLIPDTIREEADSDYGGMLSVGNSEIGERRISSVPSVFRAICQNGCIWGQEVGKGIKQVHRGKIDLGELFLEIKTNLEAQIPLLPTGIEKLLGTRRMAWDGASMLPLFAQVAMDNKLTKKQATELLKGYNVERRQTPDYAKTLFGVVNATTRAGQGLSNQEWVRFDEIGGRLANFEKQDWTRLCGRAKNLKSKEVEDTFLLLFKH